MLPSKGFVEHILEQLETIGSIRASRFFGGVGLSFDSVQFAMMMGDSLYFVVDEATREKYDHAGMPPFSYSTKNGLVKVRRYYEVPEDILADPEQLVTWTKEAIQIARATKKPKRIQKKTVPLNF